MATTDKRSKGRGKRQAEESPAEPSAARPAKRRTGPEGITDEGNAKDDRPEPTFKFGPKRRAIRSLLDCPVKKFKSQPTKRAKLALLKLDRPKTQPTFAQLVGGALKDVEGVEQLNRFGRSHYIIKFTTVALRDQATTQRLTLRKEWLGAEADLDVRLEPYLAYGPRVFITDNIGSMGDHNFVAGVAAHIKHARFWPAAQACLGARSGVRLVAFDGPIELRSFELTSATGFRVRFRPAKAAGPYGLCKRPHSERACPDLAKLDVPADCADRCLADNPAKQDGG